jgi:hypothetical protein
MDKIYFKILFLTFLFLQPVSLANAGTAEKNNFLTQVLSLAEKPKQYFILDIGEGKLSLMIRGIVLREWKVDRVRSLGEPIPLKPFPLISKNIQLAQLRRHVNIDDESEDDPSGNSGADNKSSTDDKSKKKYEFIALEVDSMPANYQIFFDEGITINVRSQAEGSKAIFKDYIEKFKEYLYAPILAIWPSNDKTKFTKIDMFFKDKTEAQALFWAFNEGTECLFLPADSKNNEDFKLVNIGFDKVEDKMKSAPKNKDK